MPLLIQYLFKLFISLAIVYLFYQLVLRRLTFYKWNRWYLLGYTMLCFLIPFIDITPVLENNKLVSNEVVSFIPSVTLYANGIESMTECPAPVWSANWNKWDWILLVFITGSGFLLLRFFINCISFFRLRNKAHLIWDKGMKLYQVDKPIIPFSFGNSIFINPQLHGEAELQEIIRHEFVHVKQKHTHDIICSEFLCILNWYNPFAWLIRRAIRQNLEFIADHKVLENGIDRKQYQYMLLKVIGNDHFSIGNQFNFSSLKKRITMMNKMKSARMQLIKFLFILPLMAVTLLSFRSEKQTFQQNPDNRSGKPGYHFTDTVQIDLVTTKGYFVHKIMKNGEMVVIVEDKNRKFIEQVPMAKWDADEDYYSNKYGYPLPPPPPPPPPAAPDAPEAPAPPAAPRLPKNIVRLSIDNNKARVGLKDGKEEIYDLGKPEEKAAFEKKYGKMNPDASMAPPPPSAHGVNTNVNVYANEDRAPVAATITSVSVGRSVAATVSTDAAPVAAQGAGTTIGTPVRAASPVAGVGVTKSPQGVASMVYTSDASPVVAPAGVTVAGGMRSPEPVMYGEPFLTLKIFKSTTREKLDKLIQQAKEKGVELEFDKIEYNSKNEITSIAGTIKKENSKSTFSITDFEVLNLMVTKKGDKYSCLVYMNNNREEI